MAHYDQDHKEVSKRGPSAQRRPLRGLRPRWSETPDQVIGFVGMLTWLCAWWNRPALARSPTTPPRGRTSWFQACGV